jgi:hypothetical protein
MIQKSMSLKYEPASHPTQQVEDKHLKSEAASVEGQGDQAHPITSKKNPRVNPKP